MKRILFMVFKNFFWAPAGWFKLCYYANHVDKYTEEQRYSMLKNIVSHANKGGRVTIQAFGTENIPKENGFMIYPNHQGFYDVLSLVAVCDNPISVVMKKEIKKVPFLKQVFACMKAFAIDRDDIRQSLQVILDTAKEVKNGRNYVIFAEGTRSKNGNNLLDFKGGSFKIATKAKCPIVPVAIMDSYKVFDTNSIKPVTVQVHFLPQIPYDVYKNMKTPEIAQEVKNQIEKAIQKYEKV